MELGPFVRFREEHWSDEELRALQHFLLVSPDAGQVIPGTHSLRKLRWTAQGRGKTGGARVICYWQSTRSHICLISGYVKSARDDLTEKQRKILVTLMKDIRNG